LVIQLARKKKMDQPTILFCTTNPGKLTEIKNLLGDRFNIVSPRDIGIDLEVEEDGDTLEANATKKLQEHLRHEKISSLKGKFVVMADDTGLQITALNGEPGIKVRRWNGTKMKDEEIVQHCLNRMRGITNREAQFRCIIALAFVEREATLELVEGILKGRILEEADPLRIEGFPMESLFVMDDAELLLGKYHGLSLEQKLATKVATHREIALKKAMGNITSYFEHK
jgi:XTP/dITP diphosphohydrolase